MRPNLAMLLLVVGCAAASPAPSPAKDATRQQITILYDAFGKPSQMEKDWGFAALIEYGGKRILFDTGNNPDILARNAKAKGVDLSKLDFVVLSHRHGDHMGGLDYLLRVNPKDGWPIQARFWLEWGSSTAGQSLPVARSRFRAV